MCKNVGNVVGEIRAGFD